MTNEQLYLVISAPIMANALFFTLSVLYINAKIDGFRNSVNERFDAINQRFDDMREMWSRKS